MGMFEYGLIVETNLTIVDRRTWMFELSAYFEPMNASGGRSAT